MTLLQTPEKSPEKRIHLTDTAFKGLPIPWVKTAVEKTLKKTQLEKKIDAIISWNISITGEWKKTRYIDTSAGYYVYPLQLSDTSEIDVIFYSHTNEKVLIRFENNFEEISIGEDKTLLEKITSIYPLPVYTQDWKWGIRLVAAS